MIQKNTGAHPDTMSQMNDLILQERHDDVVTLSFNDPDHLNAMTRAMGEAFAEQVTALAQDTALRAVILTGRGRAFSAGGDMAMLQEQAAEGRERPGIARRAIRDRMRSFYTLFLAVRELPCPTIAALNGHAIGAGFCVALACDLRLVAQEARLGLNFTKLGLHPGMAATWTLPRLVGPALAAELLYTSRVVGGEEAVRIGLATRALPTEEVLGAAKDMAAEMAACSPVANRAVKRALARSQDASLQDQLSFEAAEQAITFETEDVHEGLAALQARRAPRFQGH